MSVDTKNQISNAQIQETLKELRTIVMELQKKSQECKVLREQKKELDEKVLEYLNIYGITGLKYGNLTIESKEKKVRKTLKKKDKMIAAQEYLEKIGVKNADKITKELFESVIKSDEEDVKKLSIKNPKE